MDTIDTIDAQEFERYRKATLNPTKAHAIASIIGRDSVGRGEASRSSTRGHRITVKTSRGQQFVWPVKHQRAAFGLASEDVQHTPFMTVDGKLFGCFVEPRFLGARDTLLPSTPTLDILSQVWLGDSVERTDAAGRRAYSTPADELPRLNTLRHAIRWAWERALHSFANSGRAEANIGPRRRQHDAFTGGFFFTKLLPIAEDWAVHDFDLSKVDGSTVMGDELRLYACLPHLVPTMHPVGMVRMPLYPHDEGFNDLVESVVSRIAGEDKYHEKIPSEAFQSILPNEVGKVMRQIGPNYESVISDMEGRLL